jgi:hypothetical protein
MTENEQAEAAWRTAMAVPDVAAMIATDAQENLGGLDVLSVGSVFEPTAKRPVASPWRAPARRYLDPCLVGRKLGRRSDWSAQAFFKLYCHLFCPTPQPTQPVTK